MTTIKATCPGCGEVELTPDDVELHVCSYTPASFYNFECPMCREYVKKPADDRVIQLLISGGVRAKVWELPAEMGEHPSDPMPDGYVLDAIIDLHTLDDESIYARLMSD